MSTISEAAADRDTLRAEVAELRRRVEHLEARAGPRDAADAAMLPAIATAVGGRTFSSRDLFTQAAVDAALGEALESCDVTNPREAGKLLARLETQPIVGGFRLQRVALRRHVGIVWQIVVVPV